MWLGSGGAAREREQKEKFLTDTERTGEKGAGIEGDKEARQAGSLGERKKIRFRGRRAR